MVYLERIISPRDLHALGPRELEGLAEEIRTYLVQSVSRTGGHLGPNLGVVELTIALHRVFDSPRDPIVFDTGHQSYVHKLLTGRRDFSTLRQEGGLSGYPSRAESVHDVVESSHASAALSWAAGIAASNELRELHDRTVVAVVGDGALTGGMSWEALNNIADHDDFRLVIVINDNGRSYAPTIGGVAHHLDALRTAQGYEKVMSLTKRMLADGGKFRKAVYGALHGLKKGVKDVVAPQGMFEDLGLKYIGPVDGHDIGAMEYALRRAKSFGGPVIVHAITEKGRGYTPAEVDVADRFHAIGAIHPETGLPLVPSRFGWTSVFADELVRIGRADPQVVAITAAMLAPVGLAPFAAEFPERVFDVGIAEQHAITTAAGMAFTGLHPVVALYATFLNRAFDQLTMDAALHQAGITLVLDRAGLTGDDGASHNGQWDMAIARMIPGVKVAAPRDEATLRASLRTAVGVTDGPTVVRYPKGEIPPALPTIDTVGEVDILARAGAGEAAVLVVGVGAMAGLAVDVADAVAAEGVATCAAAPLWVLPVPADLVRLAAAHDLVVCIEDGIVTGGCGDALAEALSDAGLAVPVRRYGIPGRFLAHATRAQLLEELGLTAPSITADLTEAVALLRGDVARVWDRES